MASTPRSRALACVRAVLLAAGAAPLFPGGCTSISVAPSCPAELRVGESGPVAANERDPGGIPVYRWEAVPAEAGTFENPDEPETTFQALQEGTVELRLIAGDGLYQITSSCTTVVRGATALAVSLTAEPAAPTTGDTVTLTCRSVGETEAVMLEITQVAGPRIALTPGTAGVVTLVPLIAGSPRFQCVGTTADGVESDPAFITLTVSAPPDAGDGDSGDGGGGNGDGNGDDGTDGGGDGGDGTDGGGGRRKPRHGGP